MDNERNVQPQWYWTDHHCMGLMHDGMYHKFQSTSEYIEEFRDEEKELSE